VETIRLGDDLAASRIAFGCMTLGGLDRQADVAAALDAALDGGITLFDHADIYGRGRSEEVFGRFLADQPSLRDRLVLQSKCGIRFADDPPGTPKRYDLSYDHIVRSAEGSLRRLGTDRLDAFLLHRPDPLMEPDEVARAFDDLHAAGKVRAFGVSNFSVEQVDLLATAMRQPLVTNQVQFSLLHLGPVDAGVEVNRPGLSSRAAGLVDGCWRRGLRLQAWAPTGGGALSRSDPAPEHAALAERVRTVADRYGTTPLAVVLAWVLRHPAGIQPVVGTTNPDRIAAACAATDVRLSREDWYALFETARGGELP
jgi:predicted oxidoreductase